MITMASTLYPKNPIVIADDEPYILLNLSGILKANGINNVVTCQDSRKLMDILSEHEPEVLLLDLTMPHISGFELLPRIREEYPEMPVIIITGTAEVSMAVECMKLGVFDYLVKAIEASKLIVTIRRAIERRELERENISLKNHLVNQVFENTEAVSGFVFEDRKMRSLLMYIESIAGSSQTVLITGETGVGKDVIVKIIHSLSYRKGDLVSVNVAGLDDTMFSDTLFGHLKEAYTGANHARRGLVASSDGGTLFLDEIGDLSLKSQVTLLRLLETKEYYPLGSDAPRRTDARIIVATNQPIRKALDEGSFRKDLYYRLRTHQMHIPPLRERLSDLMPLIDHFLHQANEEYNKNVEGVSPDVYSSLKGYHFPGNIRELKSMIFEAVSRHDSGPLSPQFFTDIIGENTAFEEGRSEDSVVQIPGRFPTLKDASDFLIAEALKRCGGKQVEAAKLLGITGPALSRRLKTLKKLKHGGRE